MFQSTLIAGYSVTPKTEAAKADMPMIAKFGEAALPMLKKLPELYSVVEADYCAMLDKPIEDLTDNLKGALLALAKAANGYNTLEVLSLMAEFEGAYNSAVNPIREKYGVSSRYHFDLNQVKWVHRESVKREVAVGQPAEVTTKLYHKFDGNDGFVAENTNGGKLYEAVHLHYEPKAKATHQTDFKGTAMPYFAKHGKYSTEVK